MLLESNFTGIGDTFTDVIATGSHVVSTRGICRQYWFSMHGFYLPSKLDFLAFGGENDIFGSYLSLQHPFPANEYLLAFLPEMPQDAPPTPGVAHGPSRSLQISYEPSTSHLQIVRPPHNTVRIRVPS